MVYQLMAYQYIDYKIPSTVQSSRTILPPTEADLHPGETHLHPTSE